MKKLCEFCQIEYERPKCQIGRYCSRKCMSFAYKNRETTWGDKISKAKKGHGWPQGYHERQSSAQKERFKKESIWNKDKRYGKATWYWRDNPNEYRRLHKRIQRKYGTPKICEHCGRTDLVRYQWANKSGNYQENREDWLRLCPKCHRKYDTK